MPAPSIGEVIFWAVVVGVFLALPIMTKVIKGRRQTLRIAAEREADAILRAETVGHLKSVYVSLADFQTLSEAEKQAISVWERLSDASQLSDQETRSLAGTIDTHGDVYQALTVRWQNEAQALMRELSN